MKVKFKYARGIDGHTYAPGVHEMHDALADHWYFLALMVNKDISFVEHPKPVAPIDNNQPESQFPDEDAACGSGDMCDEDDSSVDDIESEQQAELPKPKGTQPNHKNKNKR